MEVREIINNILVKQHDVRSHFEDIINDLRTLRNLCARGPSIQLQIALNEDFQTFVHSLLCTREKNNLINNIKQIQLVGWQLMANVIVNNKQTQSLVWKNYGNNILDYCIHSEDPLDRIVDTMLMIVYNFMKSSLDLSLINFPLILKGAVCVWRSVLEQKSTIQLEFLHFTFEEFLVKDGRNTVQCYAQLNIGEKLVFADYLKNYLIQNSPNGLVHPFILQHFSKEFKVKSDCILRVVSLQEVDKIKPQEAYALLHCIALASGSENYVHIYSKDHSLFLNVSSLLRCLVDAGKTKSNTHFSPMNKLEECAPGSTISSDYQSEISFELKTLLVRCIANMLYKNDANKRYSLDTQLMPALFECTNIDARNPLIKEWSILAIRNACIGCPEIQQVVASLTQEGQVKNEVLTELNLELGSLRISPNKK